MTIEKLKARFDIKFKLQQRRVQTKLNDVIKEFDMIKSIIDECINHMPEDKIYERCDQCIEILTTQQQQLFEFRTLLKNDNPITEDDINKIIELHKSQIKQNSNDNYDSEKAKKDLLPLLDLPI